MRTVLWIALIAACGGKHDEPAIGSASDKPHHHEDRGDPATAPAALSLAVTIDGKPATWDAAAFAKVPHPAGLNNGGEARDVWSVRELAHQLAGANARVTTVIGESRSTIDAAAWSDPKRTPILHTTRRGTFKFRWADADGKWLEGDVKDVTQLELVSN